MGALALLLAAIVAVVVGTTSQCGGDESATSTTSGTTGSGGDGGDGGAGGDTGGGGGVAGEGGTGGMLPTGGGGSGGMVGGGGQGGSGGCQPVADPCGGAVCGEADDGCGTMVACGMCPVGQPCVDGACCVPKACADYPEACDGAMRDNGCGGTIFCGDAVCGDGSWMTCASGSCACAPATDYPNAAQSQADCDQAKPGSTAFYCGEPPNLIGGSIQNPEAPPNCAALASGNGGVSGNPRVWCCQ